VERLRILVVTAILVFTSLPASGISNPDVNENILLEMPSVKVNTWEELLWWETTSRDLNRNNIVDWLEEVEDEYPIGVIYDHQPTEEDLVLLSDIGVDVRVNVNLVNGLLLGTVKAELFETISNFPGVLMVEPYGKVVFYGDVQTPAIKASNSSVYPQGAWDLGVTGNGVNIAIVDTGIDNEHPGVDGKFVAGYDAVCYMHTDLLRCLAAAPGNREDDGSFDPDDGNQHGTACSGMATSTGLLSNGEQTNFTGSAPDSKLVDVKIGSDVGAGPFENYLTEQEVYESAMNGLRWVIDNKDTAWPGVDNESHGIDIISLSWGITSHENGGSDGTDMFSKILDEAMLAGVTVSVAAGNDGPGNDGLSGMGASSLSITVGALDDKNTVDRADDGIASYSSRGPRKDNEDGNPYNEMKPDVSAPGTNIIQAEACYTSGLCSNIFSDASENGYSGRGSGTSYATPAVSGVIALMIEANSELDPLEIREILRLTAERKETLSPLDGEGVEDGPWATYPELDPYWNRHFGWGMVDAYEAVQSALINTDLEDVNVSLQAHITESSFGWQTGSNVNVFTGISWGRGVELSKVEYSLDGSSWKEASYEASSNESIYVNWKINLDDNEVAFTGDHILLVRAVGESGSHSLSDHINFYAYGESEVTDDNFIAIVVVLGILVAAVVVFVAYRNKLFTN